jgi:tetratricopeptide (TPR) repeat protein
MSRTKCSIGWRWESRNRESAGVFFSSWPLAFWRISCRLRPAPKPDMGALELTSGLGRKLYGCRMTRKLSRLARILPQIRRISSACCNFSKAQATRRQYREAVATCTHGLALAPKNADLYLERGHRELGLREFKKAMSDLQQATRLAPEMLDAYYHLGLAHYFSGEFGEAAASFDKGRELAKTNDSLIDCSNWLYVSLRRAGQEQEAAQVLIRITPEVKNTEPHLYFILGSAKPRSSGRGYKRLGSHVTGESFATQSRFSRC